MKKINEWSDWTDNEQEFAKVVVKTVRRRRKELGDPPVPLENIRIGPKDFEGALHIMQGIDRHRDWKATVEYMLRLLWDKDELDTTYSRSTYTLRKGGRLYKRLEEELSEG